MDVPFVSSEDLVVLKLLWLRDKDVADARALLAASPGPDRDRIRATLDRLLPPGDPRFQLLARLCAGRE